jgi:hypothetical protein
MYKKVVGSNFIIVCLYVVIMEDPELIKGGFTHPE